MDIAQAGATRCTGEEAIAAFQEEYGEDYSGLGVRRVFHFSI